MALISSGLFPDLEGRGVLSGYEDTPNSLETDHRYNLIPFAAGAVQPPAVAQFVQLREGIEDEEFNSKYVLVEDIPPKRFSVLQCCQKDRKAHYKNLYALSVIFILLIVAHDGLVGVETSINFDKGRVTLAVENTVFVCSVVIAPAVIWLLGIRYTLLLACVLQVGYVTSNYLLSYYTLIPGAVVGGFALGIAWVSASLYLSFTSTSLGNAVNIRPTIAVGKFSGIFFTFISIGLMLGNVFTSILFVLEDEINCLGEVTLAAEQTSTIDTDILNGSNVSHDPLVCSCDAGSGIENDTRYILVSIYALIDVLAILLVLLTIRSVPRLVSNDGSLRIRILRYLKYSLVSLLRVHFSTKISLLIPVFMLSGLQAGFFLGTFTTDFIAQCIGVRYVGFAVAVWAFGSAIGSFMAGRVVIYVRRFTLFIIATGLSIFLSLFLIYFERMESFALVFLVSFGFGLSDGMLKTGISCLVTGRFHKLKTTVFSILRLWIGLGLTTHFTLSIFLLPATLLWIIIAAAGLGMPLYGLVDRNARFLWI